MVTAYCPYCDCKRGFARRLGFGTILAIIATSGLWLLAIPFYPKRCVVCGCRLGEARKLLRVKKEDIRREELVEIQSDGSKPLCKVK